ncbi:MULTISPECIES: amidohydrolase family protein [unclassified Streptomyces]|uniref:amidohydrolase family protein n=1 Tax=unclassified Streptomyces TaxID=2593676 RepID=UPI0034458ED0
MKVIALEEAFSVPDMATEGAALDQPSTFRPDFLADVERRLPDFTDLRLKDMDEHGVDMQVLSLTNPGVQMQPDARVAVSDAQLANDVLAGVVKANPTRFAGLAAMPLQDPAAAVRELDRAVNDLGLSGVLVNGHTLGHYLDEPQFRVFWEALAGHDVPLYLHPNSAPLGWSVFDGRPELIGPTYAWAVETGAHALRLITSGLFDQFPTAKVILGHMGELLPFHLSRVDTRMPYLITDVKLAKKPSEYFTANFHITTSGVMANSALLGAVLAVGIDNIMFAIDYPYESGRQAMDFLHGLPVSDADLNKIAHGNAERLLRLT